MRQRRQRAEPYRRQPEGPAGTQKGERLDVSTTMSDVQEERRSASPETRKPLSRQPEVCMRGTGGLRCGPKWRQSEKRSFSGD